MIITTQGLYHSWGKVSLGKFDEFQSAIWRERRWLDDDRASSKNGRGELADCKLDREVPWHNANGDPERYVADDDLSLWCIFKNLITQINTGQPFQPGYA